MTPRPFDEQKLKEAVEAMLDLFLQKHPKLTPSPKERAELVNKLSVELKKNSLDTPDKILNEKFLQKMSLLLYVSLQKIPGNTLINKIFADKGLSLEELLKKDDLEFDKALKAHFNPSELAQLTLLLSKMNELQPLENRIEAPRPKGPDEQRSPEEIEAESAAFARSYLGLSSKQGGMPVTVFTVQGNYLGFQDLDPDNEATPIDRLTSPNETPFGDALGTTTMVRQNFEAEGMNIPPEIESTLDPAQVKSILPKQAPQPHI